MDVCLSATFGFQEYPIAAVSEVLAAGQGNSKRRERQPASFALSWLRTACKRRPALLPSLPLRSDFSDKAHQ
eukprot:6979235-Pyramimonas_sp.AAC.1